MAHSAETGVPLALIVARADNGVIGREGGLPWHLSGDLKFFKAQTLGKPVVMGRKTFQSIGRPLPGRPNLVITRDPAFHAEGVEVFPDTEAALARAQDLAADSGAAEVMVIGGGQIYELTLPLARRVYLTEVHASPEGDTRFPDLDPALWEEVRRDAPVSGGEGQPDFSIVVLERR
ncbi:dihydrofolate reductase [Pelagibius marinus]|uniref:dihydrofolate reductase n=1 Tax=Pelagibius marinus TaxID=2762760 RepID=UPI00187329F9|nr:dihydrofolate reductase [Pelagibius marinus]